MAYFTSFSCEKSNRRKTLDRLYSKLYSTYFSTNNEPKRTTSQKMKIKLLMIGKTTDIKLVGLIDAYAKRLKHYISLEQIVIPELKKTKNITVEQQKEKEGELLIAKLSNSDEVILLDEQGTQFSSKEFAAYLSKKMVVSSRDLAFVIGGPYGFSSKVYEKADFLLSLSSMTFSHQMIRLLYIEQLYRAMTILKGEPYHHE